MIQKHHRSHHFLSRRRIWTAFCLLCVGGLTVAIGCGDDDSTCPQPGDLDPGGPVLAGTVQDNGGNPVADAVLTLESSVDGLSARVREALGDAGHPAHTRAADKSLRSATSDQNGLFAFPDVTPGSYILTATAGHHLGQSRACVVPQAHETSADSTTIDMALIPTGIFKGTVSLENATDFRDVVVYLPGTSYLALTDSAGAYRLLDVPAGTWTARATRHRFLDLETQGTITSPGQEVTLPSLALLLAENLAPSVVCSGPTEGFVGTETAFHATSEDPDGQVVLCEWDFDGDGTWDWASADTTAAVHTFTAPGEYRARVRVTDDIGAVDLDEITIQVLTDFICVSGGRGDDALTGSPAEPVQTIARGLELAQARGAAHVLVSAGQYTEDPGFVPGIHILGGREDAGWAALPDSFTTLSGGRQPESSLACRVVAIDLPTVIRNLAFVGLDATGQEYASIGLWCEDSTDDLRFEHCTFTSQAGRDGSAGTSGMNGFEGFIGAPGSVGDCNSPIGGRGGGGGQQVFQGGRGGDGGYDSEFGRNGNPGSSPSSIPTRGGDGGHAGNPGSAGDDGNNGVNGASGADGIAATAPGLVSDNRWWPAQSGDGETGVHGAGGGGGGGGGGQEGAFVDPGVGNGGGGGGGGGLGGLGGTGGQGGGASLAVLLVNASPVFVDCHFAPGPGGQGGHGGAGGTGANGGPGGAGAQACLDQVGAGGKGGNGGRGGNGGGGAGGPGGPSCGVLRHGSSDPDLAHGNSFAPGQGGAGGGGAGADNDGPQGVARDVY